MDSPVSGSGSPASSNTSPPTFYYRSDSVVVEKPSHVANHDPPSDNIELYSLVNGENSRVEVLVIEQSCNSAPQSPGSGYNSTKTTDDEGMYWDLYQSCVVYMYEKSLSF